MSGLKFSMPLRFKKEHFGVRSEVPEDVIEAGDLRLDGGKENKMYTYTDTDRRSGGHTECISST
ncbi:MAG TPA: hypothetical protein EYP57_05045 [Thermodesulfobacteriaceae bacterium]|nr:hypothetical protein [Thermodesulfobacteriaceae bacterium]